MAEVINRGQWSPGQSGNPAGGEKRAVTEVLQLLSEFDSFDDLPNKRLLAQLVWEALTHGQVLMVGGRNMELKSRDWVELVKWFYVHLDGTFRAREQGQAGAKSKEPWRPRNAFLYGGTEQTQDKAEGEDAVQGQPSINTPPTPGPSPAGRGERTSPLAPLQEGSTVDGLVIGSRSPYPLTPFPREEGKGEGTSPPAPLQDGEGRNEAGLVNSRREPPPEAWETVIQKRWEAAKAQRDAPALAEPEQESGAADNQSEKPPELVQVGEDRVTPEQAKEMLEYKRMVKEQSSEVQIRIN